MKQLMQNLKDGKVYLIDIPVPQLGNRGALVRTFSSVVSVGTEKAVSEFSSSSLLGKAKARPDLVSQVVNKVKTDGIVSAYKTAISRLDDPLPLGYSLAGEIIALGKEVSGFSVGDRVACGGGSYACHAEINYIPRNLMVKIPECISYEEAAFAAIGSVALQGVRLAKLELGERVAVIGLGLIGLLTVQIIKAAGCKVLAIDISEDRANISRDLGADFAATGEPHELEEKALAFSNGRGVDAVFIAAATKSSDPIDLAGRISRQKGRVVVIGDVGMDVPRRIYYPKELELIISMSYGPGRYDPTYEEKGIDYPYPYVPFTEQRNMETFLGLVESGNVIPSRLISHRFPIVEAERAYAEIAKGDQAFLGVVFSYPDVAENTSIMKVGEGKVLSRTEEVVSAGLIGAGNFAKLIILPNLAENKEISLVGVSAKTGTSCKHVAEKYGFQFCTTDNEEILGNSDINTVYIATRHNLHAELVARSLAAGKHTFVEKPLATSDDDLRRVYEASIASDKVLMVGFNRRFSDLGIEAKKLFAAHEGPLSMLYRVNAGSVPRDHWTQDYEEGAGRIIGEVCHFVDFLQYICGSLPVGVFATGTGTAGSEQLDDNVTITLRFKDGSIGHIDYFSTGNKSVSKEYIEIYGEGSTLIIDDFKKARIASGSRSRTLRSRKDKGHSAELVVFAEAVRSGRMPIPLEEMTYSTLATFRILDSLNQKCELDVDWKLR